MLKTLLTLTAVSLGLAGAVFANDYSFLPECVSSQRRVAPISKIDVLGAVEDYLLLELVSPQDYRYPVVVKTSPTCEIVSVDPDNFPATDLANPDLPEHIGQALTEQRIQGELEKIGKAALFRKYNSQTEAGFLWLSREELRALEKIGFKPSLAVRHDYFDFMREQALNSSN